MRSPNPRFDRFRRNGIAAVEMAVVLPLLVFLCLIALDFGRVFYSSLIVANCARNAALWECDPYRQSESPHKNIREAALADGGNLNDPDKRVTVTSQKGTDSANNTYVEVTVTYEFWAVTSFPGIPTKFNIIRTVRAPTAPNNPT